MGIFVRGRKLWARFKDPTGAWVSKPTPYEVGQESDARRYLARRTTTAAAVRDAKAIDETRTGGATPVRVFADKWRKERRALGVRSIADDDSRMKRHILPELGDLSLEEVQSRHVRELVLKLRMKTLREDEKLAPRTVRNIYGLLSTMFRDAVADGLVATTPCVLRRGVLPKKADKDPAWRPTAIYTREETERLISDRRIPEDRRVLYSLKGLAGLRHGGRPPPFAGGSTTARLSPRRPLARAHEDRRAPAGAGPPYPRPRPRRVEAGRVGTHVRAPPK